MTEMVRVGVKIVETANYTSLSLKPLTEPFRGLRTQIMKEVYGSI